MNKYALLTFILFLSLAILGFKSGPINASLDLLPNEALIEPATSVQPGMFLKINKLGVFAPVIIGVDPTNEDLYKEALKGGIVHFSGTPLPDVNGNVVIYGHTSKLKAAAYYEKIFNNLDNLQLDDEIELQYEGTKYRYKVADKQIVKPTELSILEPSSEAILTIFTCWPIGTLTKRLVITANLANP